MFLPTRPTLRYSSSVNIVFDGNSLVYGDGATVPLPQVVAGRAPISGSGAAMTNLGIDGQTWRQMDGLDGGSSADVDGAYAPGKTNILIAWETTNAVCNTHRSATETIGDLTSYIANRKAVHPDWHIVLMTTLPRQAGSQLGTDQASIDTANATLNAVDDHLRAHYRALGAQALVDVRAPGSPFRFTSYTPADFDATATYWSEASGSRIHLNDTGYLLVASMIALTLRRLSAR